MWVTLCCVLCRSGNILLFAIVFYNLHYPCSYVAVQTSRYPKAVGDPIVFKTSAHPQNIVYRAEDGHIHYLFQEKVLPPICC